MIATPIHVALVEDDASMQQAMRRLLRVHGMRVTAHASAEEFLAAMAADLPDCLLLDIQLGGMSGLELQAMLVREGRVFPTVFLTAHREDSYRTTAHSQGCAGYLHKSSPADAVVAAIRNAVGSPTSV